MDKAEKTRESWPEHKKRIKHKWAVPFAYVEWICECFSVLLKRWAFLDILVRIGHLGILISLILGVGVYFKERNQRTMQVEHERQQALDQRKAKHYQAWQVVVAAQGQRISGGRIEALEDLNSDGISLMGVDISKAYLPMLNLEDADLTGANLAGAIFWDANLAGAYLTDANLAEANLSGANLAGATLFRANLMEAKLYSAILSKANLTGANLSGAKLGSANLTGANFDKANLRGAFLWSYGIWWLIESIEFANIYGVDAPEEFVKWAIEQGGAVSIEDYDEWQKFIDEKKKQEADDSGGDQKR